MDLSYTNQGFMCSNPEIIIKTLSPHVDLIHTDGSNTFYVIHPLPVNTKIPGVISDLDFIEVEPLSERLPIHLYHISAYSGQHAPKATGSVGDHKMQMLGKATLEPQKWGKWLSKLIQQYLENQSNNPYMSNLEDVVSETPWGITGWRVTGCDNIYEYINQYWEILDDYPDYERTERTSRYAKEILRSDLLNKLSEEEKDAYTQVLQNFILGGDLLDYKLEDKLLENQPHDNHWQYFYEIREDEGGLMDYLNDNPHPKMRRIQDKYRRESRKFRFRNK